MCEKKIDVRTEMEQLTVLSRQWFKNGYETESVISFLEDLNTAKADNNLLVAATARYKTKVPKPITSFSDEQGAKLALTKRILPIVEKIRKKQESTFENVKFPSAIGEEEIKKAILATSIIAGFSNTENKKDIQNMAIEFASSLQVSGSIQLLQFACPNIDPTVINQTNMNDYIRPTADQQLVLKVKSKTQGKRLKEITQILSILGIPTKIDVIFGDDDEEAYLLNMQDYLTKFENTNFDLNCTQQSRDLQTKLREILPKRGMRVRVQRWSQLNNMPLESYLPPDFKIQVQKEYEAILKDPTSVFSEKDIQDEMERTKELFQSYYEGVFGTPEKAELKLIAIKKMAWYAYQGAIIKFFYPFGVYLMNEQPVNLRTKMLRGIEKDLVVATPYYLK